MTLVRLSLAALLAAAAFTPALADDDGTPLGAYLQSMSAPAATPTAPATKMVEGRQAHRVVAHAATPAAQPVALQPLTDAERYLIQR